MPARHVHQLAHLVVRQERRGTAAPVQLFYGIVFGIEIARLQRKLPTKVLQVLGRTPVVLGDDLVARAVVADGGAEWQVKIQRERSPILRIIAAKFQPATIGVGVELRSEPIGRGIRGIARPIDIKAMNQCRVENEGVGEGRHVVKRLWLSRFDPLFHRGFGKLFGLFGAPVAERRFTLSQASHLRTQDWTASHAAGCLVSATETIYAYEHKARTKNSAIIFLSRLNRNAAMPQPI